MKTNLHILFIYFIGIIFIACSSTIKTSTSKTTDIYGAGVIHKPVIVDLEVRETKVSGSAESNSTQDIESVKYAAVVDALKNAKADVLVEPVYETTIIGTKKSATVTGFPGTYKNFRTIKQEDLQLIQAGIVQKAEVYVPSVGNAKKKQR